MFSHRTLGGVRQHATYSLMRFILVPATALLKIVGPGDMSGAALVTVLVSENQCTALIDFISPPATSRQYSRAIGKQKLIHLCHNVMPH